MNPYLESRKELGTLGKSLKNNIIKQKKLVARIEEIKKSCTHQDENGNPMGERIGQDPGSGKTDYQCQLCFRYL